jgi:mRNA interferase RelE/StbE
MKIEFSPKAARQFKKLHRRVKLFQSLKAAIRELADEPYLGKMLEGEFDGMWSLRVGEWRVIYEVHEDRLIVHIVSIADRKEAYR